MKVLITGITGRVGSHLMHLLRARGIEVKGFALPNDPLLSRLPADLEVIQGDITDPMAMREAVRDVSHIMHLAAVILYHPHEDDLIWRVNVDGTRNLLTALAERPSAPLHVAFASSDQVYPGPFPRYVPTDEDHPLEPYTPYGLSKLLGEAMVRFAARSLPDCTYTIVRFCHNQTWEEIASPEGPFSSRQFFVRGRLAYLKASGRSDPATQEAIRLLEPLAKDDPLLLVQDEHGVAHSLDILDTRDVAAGLLPVLLNPSAHNEVFNFAPSFRVSYSQVIPYMGRVMGRSWVEVRMPGPRPRSMLSGGKARAVLGFRQRYTIFDMIDQAAAHRNQEEGS